MKHFFTFERFSMYKKEIINNAEKITSEIYKIANIVRIINEVIIYNSDNGVDCEHIAEVTDILNIKLNDLIELCENYECLLYNHI